MKALAAALLLAALPSLAHAEAAHSKMLSSDELKWADAPSVGPGAKIAVIEGPLDKPVPFTFRLKLPANLKVAPHTHPAFERVTVLSGTFHFAHGERYDESKTRPLKPGDVAIMPPGAPMFGYTREETVIQLHGVGPWGIAYLNPADDPRRK
jgi:quercetin dioxygenase-like cupin family protein